ncbi:hypothetical protein [Streptomyces sp. R33]|uniref:Uncharacterized protein n=1 Tax=Streptomyces sp. R33 TaxID=3238629 RepID=A0AB39YFH7_9ACTN
MNREDLAAALEQHAAREMTQSPWDESIPLKAPTWSSWPPI